MAEPIPVPAPKVQMFGLVRDKHGKPLVDDPKNLHPAIKAMLTEAEKAELGVD